MKHIAGRRPIFHSKLSIFHSSRSEAATFSYEKSWMLDEGGIWAIRNARILDRVIGMMVYRISSGMENVKKNIFELL